MCHPMTVTKNNMTISEVDFFSQNILIFILLLTKNMERDIAVMMYELYQMCNAYECFIVT